MNEYYSGEQLDNYPPKKGKGKLPLFCGYAERVIPIYASTMVVTVILLFVLQNS